MDSPPLFLTAQELSTLTGRKLRKRQIEALRNMHIPFHVNAIGHPVVTRDAIASSGSKAAPTAKTWQPKVVGRG